MFQFYKQIKDKVDLRRKLLLTLAVFFSYILQGWSEQQVGIALPSIQDLIDVDQEKLSTILVVWNIGYVAGSLVSGVLFDKFNRLVLMFLLTLGLAVGTATLPFCKSLLLMLVCRFFLGVFNGGSDTGSNTIIPTVWQDRCGPFSQVLYVCYAVGGILSPFATLPFISKVSGSTGISNSTNNSTLGEKQGESLYPAFIITSVLFLISAIPYVLMNMFGNFNNLSNQSVTNDIAGDLSGIEKHEHSKILVCLMAVIHALSVAGEEDLTSYLMIFSTEYLRWDELDSATLTSAYWISSCCSGVIGILIVNFVDYSKVLSCAIILVNFSLGSVLLGCLAVRMWLIWTGFICCGSAMIMFIPTLFSWSQKYACEITGKVSAIFTVSAGIFSAASAYFIGFMFDNYSKLSFIIILFSFTILCQILFCCAYFVRFKFCQFELLSNYALQREDRTLVLGPVSCISYTNRDIC